MAAEPVVKWGRPLRSSAEVMDLDPPSAVEQSALLDAGWRRIHGATERLHSHKRANRRAFGDLVEKERLRVDDEYRELIGCRTIGEPSSSGSSVADSSQLSQMCDVMREETVEMAAFSAEMKAEEEAQGGGIRDSPHGVQRCAIDEVSLECFSIEISVSARMKCR